MRFGSVAHGDLIGGRGPTALQALARVARLPAPETKRAARKGGTRELFYWRVLWCQSTQALVWIVSGHGNPCGKGIIRRFQTYSSIRPASGAGKNVICNAAQRSNLFAF
jgi:hypothetical protein